MTKKQKWEALIAFIDQLREEQFKYSFFVSEMRHGCGTVCCIAGWFPKIFPKDWEWNRNMSINRCDDISIDPQVLESLVEYMEISEEDAGALFYGHIDSQKYLGLPIVPSWPSTLEMVRNLFHTYANKFIFIHEEPT